MRSTDPKDYVAVLPLDELMGIQNLVAGVVLAQLEGELDRYNWEALLGASNRLCHFTEEPVEVCFEEYLDGRELRRPVTGP
jgi:hypothetical protein